MAEAAPPPPPPPPSEGSGQTDKNVAVCHAIHGADSVQLTVLTLCDDHTVHDNTFYART